MGINLPSAQIKAWWLRQVDLKAKPAYHIKVEAGKFGVDQRAAMAAGPDLGVKACGMVQPSGDFGPGQADGGARVGVNVKIGCVTQQNLACRHVGVIVRPAPPAGLEGGSRSQHGQICESRVGQHGGHMQRLCPGDKGHGRRRGDQRKIAVQGHIRPANGAACPCKGITVRARHTAHHPGVACHQRACATLCAAHRYGPHPGPVGAYLIPGAGPCKIKVDDPQMGAMKTGHHSRFSIKRTRSGIDPIGAGEIGRWKHQMRMTGDQGINAVQCRQRGGRIFHALSRLVSPDAGMRQCHDQLGTRTAHQRDQGFRGQKNVFGQDFASKVLMIPDHDLGRGKADDADGDRVGRALRTRQHALQKDIPRHKSGVGLRVGAAHHIGRHDRERRPLQRGFKKGQAVAEFMVAKRRRIIAQVVHRGDHRVQVAGGRGAVLCH